MAIALDELVSDLSAESRSLLDVLEPLPPGEWERPTPAAGWAVRDQVSHLAYFDEAAVVAATEPERFRAEAERLMDTGDDFTERVAERHRSMPPAELLDWFRTARRLLLAELGALDGSRSIPWYGPNMSVASSLTARLMETWAHGEDVAEALDVQRPPTTRLRHVAHLGVRTMGFSLALHDQPAPADPVRVELAAPDGTTWTSGPEGAADLVRGPMLDFCLVVTQRRHLDDTSLEIRGPVAARWMSVAQAFAGPPGPGRERR